MRSISEFKSEAFLNKAIQLLVHTDGDGQLLDCSGETSVSGETVAEGIDVARGALDALADALKLGELTTSLVFYKKGFLVLGTSPKGENVAVMAYDGTNAGLVLAQLRSLIAQLDE
jgi:hypothetical protein